VLQAFLKEKLLKLAVYIREKPIIDSTRYIFNKSWQIYR